MRFPDLVRLAGANLRRNRTRSLLTLLGVAVAVAALLTLLGYGAGLQQNARQEFDNLQLYNTLRVTATPDPVDALGSMRTRAKTTWVDTAEARPLTDSLLGVIRQLDGVLAAYPEVVFPVEVEANGREVVATAEAVPQAFAGVSAYQPVHGRFFATARDSALLIAPSMARRLGFAPAEAAVGETIELTTVSMNLQAAQLMAPALVRGVGAMPLKKTRHRMRVAGLLEEEGQVVSSFLRVLLPLDLATEMDKVPFFSTFDLLLRRGNPEGYAALRVQLADAEALDRVRADVEALGVHTLSFRDQFRQFERLFLLMDLALGIIGFIALLVATFGIANTMLMNVLERTQEIGVMKAVGGDERDLQRLFIVESTGLGLAGGLIGLVFGWVLLESISALVNAYLRDFGVPHVEVFHLTPGMVLGVLAVSGAVSLIAGLLPARRAAHVEPLAALRA